MEKWFEENRELLIKELKFKPIPIEELLKDCYVGEEKVKQTLGQILKS